MDEEFVAVSRITSRNDEGMAIRSEADVTDKTFIEDFVDAFAYQKAPKLLAPALLRWGAGTNY